VSATGEHMSNTPTAFDSISATASVFPLVAGREDPRGFQGNLAGTGFFVSPKGLALTALHVAQSAAEGSELRAMVAASSSKFQSIRLRRYAERVLSCLAKAVRRIRGALGARASAGFAVRLRCC
jgi:hypothetical protein